MYSTYIGRLACFFYSFFLFTSIGIHTTIDTNVCYQSVFCVCGVLLRFRYDDDDDDNAYPLRKAK